MVVGTWSRTFRSNYECENMECTNPGVYGAGGSFGELPNGDYVICSDHVDGYIDTYPL